MRLTARGTGFLVYDEVLDAEAFHNLWNFMQRTQYCWVHAQGWLKAWRLTDGTPLGGPPCFSDPETATLLNPGAAPPPGSCYPTGRPIDALLALIAAGQADWTGLIGQRGQNWIGFTAKPFLYPQGAGLSWHEDTGSYTGAFVYYAHPQWNVQWGGELMFTAEVEGDRARNQASIYSRDPAARTGQHLDNALENERLMERGLGQFVFAKPNRLIIVQTGVAHAINPVTRAAGDHVRASIAGFFIATPAERQRRAAALRGACAPAAGMAEIREIRGQHT